MSDRKDLTRWNRAGLSRFTYVDGNAVEYLEILRRQLAHKFEDANWLVPAEPVPVNEEKVESETLLDEQKRLHIREQRLLEMYHQDRRDWAWEITRTFARSCHILSGYADAWANEGYLGTATQWDNVRRLVGLLDYHPAPPSSATTRLVFEAKNTGTIKKGFQVKNSPLMGAEKVIFETQDDLYVDPALNGLRPAGWDKSEEPAISPSDNNGSGQPPAGVRQFSSIARGLVIHLQGVGAVWGDILDPQDTNVDPLPGGRVSKIKDFLDFDPDSSEGHGISVIRLRELKAKASAISNFELDPGCSDLADWLLPDIASESSELLVDITGKSLKEVKLFQLKIALIGAYLDQGVYENAKLEDLVAPLTIEEGTVVTSWKAKRKPKIGPDDVALIYRVSEDESTGKFINEAEAATIASIELHSELIHLALSPVQQTWPGWGKSEVALKVSPRWQRKCWLNGSNVIRTKAPHGLAVGTFIGWNADWNATNAWNYSKIEYAEILEVDKRNLRLKYGYGLHLVTVDGADNLNDKGRSLVVIAQVGNQQLHIRIFDVGGEIVVDIPDNDLLHGNAFTNLKQQLNPFPDVSDLSPEVKQKIIENAAACADYALLPEEHTALIELRPIDSSILSADYKEIVLLNGKGEPDQSSDLVEDVPPGISDSPFKNIFEIDDTVTENIGGGGLLPPGALPKIGSFLFPSPMLPMDLVKAAVELMLSLGVMQIPSSGEIVIKGVPFTGVLGELADELPVGSGMDALAGELYNFLDTMVKVDKKGKDVPGEKLINWLVTPPADTILALEKVLNQAGGEPSSLFQQILVEIEQEGFLLATPKNPPSKTEVDSIFPRYVVNSKAKNIVRGDWVVGRFTDGLRAIEVASINEFIEESFAIAFENLGGNEGELQNIYADFRGELIAEGATFNTTQLDSDEIELEDIPESLTIGRKVLLMADDKDPVAATIVDIDGKIITTDPPAVGFTIGNLIICGNVVEVGHGETKPAKILGSGNAAKSNQEFTIEVKGISFTPDATMRPGVAAAIEVDVAGRIWKQMATLKDSVPDDHHYSIRMTEESYVKILFGDGKNGRRLPSGKNNVRVRYRVGSGLTGNVAAQNLEKPVNKSPLVDSVFQPVQAAGGGDMEDISSLRENAPSTLLALERAVSLSDFADLATGRSNIWQAKARSVILHAGQMEQVKVTVVPADGVSSDEIIGDVREFLQVHALPGVQVIVESFKPATEFDMKIMIRVKSSEILPNIVSSAVTAALKDRFSLKKSRLGGALYLSEVYKVVENVEGVENSICKLECSGRQLQIIRARDTSIEEEINAAGIVVYLDPAKLMVDYEEYRP